MNGKKGEMTKQKWLVCALLGVVLWGCGGRQEAVVARVGEVKISKEELQTYVLDLPRSHQSKKEGQAAREDYLQSMIDYELLWLEARARGLDTATAVQKSLERKIRKNLLTVFMNREKVEVLEVAEVEVERRFKRKGLDRERRRLTWGIMTKTAAKLDEALAQLEAGVPFGEVAASYSITPDAEVEGKLGWLGVEATQRMGIADSLFYGLPLGQVSPPLSHSEGFFVVRFSEEEPVDYLDFRDELLAELQEEKRIESLAARAELLAQEYDWRPHGPGVQLLLQKGRNRTDAAVRLTPEEARTPLFLFADSQVQVADYLHELEGAKINTGLRDSATVVNLGQRLLLQSFVLAAAAQRQGYINEDSLAATRHQMQNEEVLGALRQVAVLDAIEVTEEKMRRYYDEQTHRFYARDKVEVAEVLVESEKEALEVRAKIEAGTDISALARERSLRRGARTRGGIFPMEKTSDLVPSILRAEDGELVGPVELHDGYSVFKIVRREKGERQSFAQARRQIEGILRRAEERQQFTIFLQNLRRKYADQVEVDTELLIAALPDEFLAAH